MRSRLTVATLAGLLAVALAGCAGSSPRPSPTPTPPFASADAAYRAAEATYRAYVDATNEIDVQHPESFQPVYSWLLGDALDTDRKQLSAIAAKEWRWTGASRVALMRREAAAGSDPRWGDVRLAVCLDVHDLRITDRNGKSVVARDRPDVQPLSVDFVRDGSSPTGLKIDGLNKRSGDPKCD